MMMRSILLSGYLRLRKSSFVNPEKVPDYKTYWLLYRLCLFVETIMELWKSNLQWMFIAFDSDFSLIHFNSSYDYDFALLEGP